MADASEAHRNISRNVPRKTYSGLLRDRDGEAGSAAILSLFPRLLSSVSPIPHVCSTPVLSRVLSLRGSANSFNAKMWRTKIIAVRARNSVIVIGSPVYPSQVLHSRWTDSSLAPGAHQILGHLSPLHCRRA